MTTDRFTPWHDRAACRGLAPMFDAPTEQPNRRSPAERERIRRATAVCARCVVVEQCRADTRPGRDEGIRFGVVLPAVSPLSGRRDVRERAS